jgi:hypothetical protein
VLYRHARADDEYTRKPQHHPPIPHQFLKDNDPMLYGNSDRAFADAHLKERIAVSATELMICSTAISAEWASDS